MSNILRWILIIASVFIVYWILRKIRKAKVKMEDAIFWMFFSAILVILALFPEIAYFFSSVVGIMSPANLIFLVIITVLVIKVFSLSVSLSLLEEKISILSAEVALRTHVKQNQDGELQKKDNEGV